MNPQQEKQKALIKFWRSKGYFAFGLMLMMELSFTYAAIPMLQSYTLQSSEQEIWLFFCSFFLISGFALIEMIVLLIKRSELDQLEHLDQKIRDFFAKEK